MTKRVSVSQHLAKRIFQVLPKGSDSPMTRAELSERLGENERTTKAIVARMVDLGFPIGSLRDTNHHGYFIITNDDEKAQALAPLISTSRNLEKRIRQLKNIDVMSDELVWEERLSKL